ncbi:MAG: hypothetical protein WCJ64_10385, partial [Rhodospirillaceae bacterium]
LEHPINKIIITRNLILSSWDGKLNISDTLMRENAGDFCYCIGQLCYFRLHHHSHGSCRKKLADISELLPSWFILVELNLNIFHYEAN